VKDVLLDRGSSVNIIIEDLKKKLKLLVPKPTPYTLRMEDQTLTKLIRLIRDLKIHIHDILYIITFTVMKNNILDVNYSMR
jgi:predicted phosphatase